MANVDKELHNPETVAKNLIRERTTSKPKRGIRGTAGGNYIGPILSNASGGKESSLSHATGIRAGGTEDSTGYRKSDTYVSGTDVTSVTATVRPNPGSQTERSMHRADGVQGGSVRGYPAQRVGQRSAAAAPTGELTAESQAAAFIDKRSNAYGDGGRALGSSGRGSRVLGETVSLSAPRGKALSTATDNHRFKVPVLSGDDPSASGNVQLVDGTSGAVHADVHADDITAGANDWAGVVIFCFAKDTDTDEDLALVAMGDFDTVTEGAVTGLTGLTAGDYAFYAAFKDAEGNVGPWSNRFALTIT